MARWDRYWFRAGGRTSAAVLRIAIGISVLWMLVRLHDGGAAANLHLVPHAQYEPDGILQLFPGEPGSTTFAIVWVVAWVATIAMIAGAWSRAATAVSFAAALVIASYEYSFMAGWSHDNNAPLLAQLAFLGARGGDAWSVDAWWRKRRGTATPEGSYMWSIQLVQLAIGVMMASAAYSKLLAGGPSVAWVFSDNLRNHILVRFDLNGMPRTAIADWLVAEPVRWQTAAVLNLVAQVAPLAGCFMMKRPVWRALLGGMFAVETIGLDLVMGFSNFHWLPLTAAFLDWDRLLARVTKRPAGGTPAAPPSRAARVYVIAFVICDVVISFWRWPQLDRLLRPYPLSRFPMFASIRARVPYDTHQLYEVPGGGGRFDVTTAQPLPEDARVWIRDHLAGIRIHEIRDPERLRIELAGFSRHLHETFPALTIESVRANVVAIQAAPYPTPARLDRVDVAILGELLADGTYTTALGRVAPDGGRWAIVPGPAGAAPPPLAYHQDGALVELGAAAPGEPLVVDRLPRRAPVVARVGTRWFFVGARP